MRLILSLFFLISANVFGDISVCQNCEKKSCFELQDKQARIECKSLQKYKINEVTKFVKETESFHFRGCILFDTFDIIRPLELGVEF